MLNNDLLIENLECAILVIDPQGLIQQVNIAGETLFCQSRRLLLGMQINEVIANNNVKQYIDDCFANNTRYTLRELAIDLINQQQILVDVTVSALMLVKDRPSYVLIELNSVNRISRFMKEENQLARQQVFRLMMRGLAHEIKNPLGGLRGAAQLLDRALVDSSQKELTDIMIKETDRLSRLVDRVMGPRAMLKPEPVNIHEVLEHVINLVSARYPEQLRISRFYDPALPEISVDKEQIIQALLNIVGNAIDSQSDQDTAQIGFVTQFERYVTINHEPHRQVLRIQIWDEGAGVLPELKDNLFDPLITGRADGTGLGLSITQEIVQRHQGVVKLEDYQGKTCFSIYLPYLHNDAKQ